ncbi:DUF3592 domain-containing protein [Marinobacterium jannaschii]|uniref:DUF3592 domain-containing protein n=1 Tax=Marinobacterium jannaschii TaxID=64970 RepID=UPI000ACAB9C2|nr:DUF3592 domain-containing protein [Marinobacterium jannaschii]
MFRDEGRNRRIVRGLVSIALVVSLYIVYDRATLLVNATQVPSTIVDCGSEWVKVSDGPARSTTTTRYRDQVQYYPMAVSPEGDKAVGWLMMPNRSWCSQMVGREVSILVYPDNPAENRIYSFLQFWALPLLILAFAICIPLSQVTARGVRLFGAVFALSFTGFVLEELGKLDSGSSQSESSQSESADGSQTRPVKDSPSKKALDRCVYTAKYEAKLEDRSELKSLRCIGEEITDLSSIADLTQLEALYLQNNALNSLQGIEAFPRLRTLSVAGNKALTSTRGIEHLLLLEEFQANKASLSDLSGMDKLAQLKVVGLMMNDIRDVSAFAGLSQLEDVTLNYNRISNISAFANKPKLTAFMAYSNQISDASALFGNRAMLKVGLRGKRDIPCEQIDQIRAELVPDAKVYGPKRCGE